MLNRIEWNSPTGPQLSTDMMSHLTKQPPSRVKQIMGHNTRKQYVVYNSHLRFMTMHNPNHLTTR